MNVARTSWARRLGLMCVTLTVMAASASSGSAAEKSPGQGALRAAIAPSRLTPVIQSVPSPPRWFVADDRRVHLAYDVLLTNATPVSVKLASLEVLNGRGARIARLSGPRLQAATGWEGGTPPTTTLGPFTTGVAWIDLTFANTKAVPRRLKDRLTINLPLGLPAPPVISDTSANVAVTRHAATIISPPLRGGRWVAIGGPLGPHRRALQPINGALRNGQRFAVDFSALLDAKGRTHAGNSSRNSSYFNYGQPVLAVGAGRVVDAVDRYPDQIPNHNVHVRTEAGDGNHVIIKLGNGVFAAYAHLKPGSVRVRVGQRVRAGQVLGQLGNSGETTGPHLHFQLMTRPSVADSDGLPFMLDQFRLDGHLTSLQAFINSDLAGTPVPINRAAAGKRRHQGFTDLDVVTFASG
jgi:murein DD-endopeptidase MepM/ murein hydrolase activator NlpD